MRVEALHYLNCKPGGLYADGTLGGCGHAAAILEKIMPDGLLIGLDQDVDAIRHARKALERYEKNIRIYHENFSSLPGILADMGVPGANGVMIDLGLSFHQIDASGRGFTFQKDEPLDMRMDVRSDVTARDLVNALPAKDLAEMFKTYGEERRARRIAEKIAAARRRESIDSTGRLAELILEATPKKAAAAQKIHPATRVFMALRIAVNRELEVLETFMNAAAGCLKLGGRLCVISFHSLEDRIVKRGVAAQEKPCTCPPKLPACACGRKPALRALTKKPVRPGPEEIAKNPMARSARLRAAEKISEG